MTLSEEMEAIRDDLSDSELAFSSVSAGIRGYLPPEEMIRLSDWIPKVKALEATAINKVFTKAQFKLLAEAVWRMKIAGMLSFDEEGIALKLEDILAKWSD